MKLLTLDQTKKMLGVSKETLHNWDKNGKLKALRTQGGHRRYKEEDVKTMMGEDFTSETSKDAIVESFRTSTEKEFVEDLVSVCVRFLKKMNNKQQEIK